MSISWNYPNPITSGAGCLSLLAKVAQERGIARPLLVTDPGLANLPLFTAAINVCERGGLQPAVFSAIKGNPNGANVEDGVVALQAHDADGVIAIGGGSALDAGKAIALMAGQDRPLWDFEDVGDNYLRVRTEGVLPTIAVPTTSGTGSEVGRASVITDEDANVKRIIFHPLMLPVQVLLDPELTLGLPPTLTATTGMDALSHSLEAWCAPAYHPMADGIAAEGMRLVKEYLPIAVADGGHLEARQQMQSASAMGATAFQKGLGAMHALAHPLGALYDAHHGLLNAILMPYVLQENREVIATRMERLAAYLGIDGGFDGFLGWVLALRESIGIPPSLAEIGIDAESAERVGELAARDPSAGGNPIELSPARYSDLLRRAVAGDL